MAATTLTQAVETTLSQVVEHTIDNHLDIWLINYKEMIDLPFPVPDFAVSEMFLQAGQVTKPPPNLLFPGVPVRGHTLRIRLQLFSYVVAFFKRLTYEFHKFYPILQTFI